MNDARYRSDSLGRSLQPAALATSLAVSAFATSCGPAQEVSLPTAQPKEIASTVAPLLGADKAKVVNTANTIINTYSKLTVDAKAGDKTITVADATALGVATGDLVMVIQMQGATIDTTDNPPPNGYGKVATLNGAGSFEIASVAAVNANTNVITLNYCGGLKNAYSAATHSQVVRVPQYTTLDVATNASITALPWDGDKGGVVAAYVQGKTGLLGNIDASGTGFRGGAKSNAAQPPGSNIVTYRSTTAADGGEHGESIAGSATEYDKLGGRYGRGAPANGGGGGDSHNAGGGGGANQTNMRDWSGQGVMVVPLTSPMFAIAWSKDPGYAANGNALTNSSGGGRGGYSFSANSNAAADPLVTGPNSAVWGGDNRREVGGLGGHQLTNSPRVVGATGAAPTLFLGGGGGAGNGNDNVSGPGGNGGGLVFLVSGSVEGTGSIVSNGAAGAGSTTDGGSGGGGGGTVVVLSGRTISNNLTLSTDGGIGGSVRIGSALAVGPGGGGGGGYVGTFTPPQLPTMATRTANGGASGTTDSTAMTAFNVDGATFGAAGNPGDTYTYQDGTTMPVCVPSDLAVTAALTQGTVAPGNTVVITVNVANSGPEPAQAVGITDTINPMLMGLTTTWTCTGNGGAVCPAASGNRTIQGIADIPVQGSLTYQVSVFIPPLFMGPLVYNALATVPPGFNDLNLNNNTATANLPLNAVPTADLAVTLSSTPNPAATGMPILYDVTVQNNGPGIPSSAFFTYNVPAGSTIQNIMAPAGWSCPAPGPQATMLTCTYTPTPASAGIPPGTLPDVQITVLPPPAATDIMTSVTVTGQGVTDPMPSNNTATNDTMIGNFPPADISVGINSTPNPATPGAPINYDVRLTNSGPNSATGATLSFNVPAGSTIQNFDNSATGWTCQPMANVVSCTYGQSVPPGSLDLAFTVLPPPAATSISVTARGLGTGVADSNIVNNTATDVDLITSTPPQADLVLTVTTAPMPPQANMPVTYTLDVANKGPADATGANLTYTIPQGGTVTSITAPNGWNCAQQTSQNQVSCWYNGTITAGTSAPDVVIKVTPMTGASSLSATTTVTPQGATDPNPADDTVTTNTSLADFKLAGGGFGCNTAPGGAPPAAGSGLMAALLGLLGLRRRRSRA